MSGLKVFDLQPAFIHDRAQIQRPDQMEQGITMKNRSHKSNFAPKPKLPLSDNPRIFVIEKFLTDFQCEYLVKASREKLERSLGFDMDRGQSVETDIRTSSHCWLRSATDPVLALIEQRIAKLTKIPVENGEDLSSLRYDIGQDCFIYSTEVETLKLFNTRHHL
jgi:hypothetical protein